MNGWSKLTMLFWIDRLNMLLTTVLPGLDSALDQVNAEITVKLRENRMEVLQWRRYGFRN